MLEVVYIMIDLYVYTVRHFLFEMGIIIVINLFDSYR